MKRVILIITAIGLLFGLCACTGQPAETQPTVSASTQPTEEPTPTPEPTVESTATPEEPPSQVCWYYYMPHQFLIYAISKNVYRMTSIFVEGGVIDSGLTPDDLEALTLMEQLDYMKEFISNFSYLGYTEVYDETTGEFVCSDEASSYDISLNVSRDNYLDIDIIADLVGGCLDLEYEDQTITSYSSNGTIEEMTNKWAEGSEDSYNSSWLYYDNDYAAEGTMRLTFVYPGLNEECDMTVSDSFDWLTVPIPEELDAYTYTGSVGYSENYYASDPAALVGNVGKTWWNVGEQDMQTLAAGLEADNSAAVIYASESFSQYYITLDDEYFEGVSVEIVWWNSMEEDEDPEYNVTYTIYYKTCE